MRFASCCRAAWLGLVGWACCCAGPALAAPDGPVDFNRDIRPLLSNNCYFCHGPDPEHRAADLRLDQRTSAVDDLMVVVPGEPDASELIARITADDPDVVMPPPSSHKQLKPEEIELFRRWIAQGAKWEEPWAYVPPQKHPLPAVKQKDWPRNWIDSFVLARLEAEGLAPSPAADRRTLIRRLYFDFLGLPPTAEEVEAFVQDPRPEAYEALVNRLLESPHFGERMAMWWLDLVRFADTVGYHGDQTHRAAPYRDWVIWAFNENMPFDQFTQAQIAGDFLAEQAKAEGKSEAEVQNLLLASCYNRLLQTTHEGGAQLKEYRAIYQADRIRNLSQVFMAATIGCAQCHDHKYDPFSARDFYALGAFFADIDDEEHLRNQYGGLNSLPTRRLPEMDLLTPLDRLKATRLDKQIAAVQAQIDALPEDERPPTSLEARLAFLKAERAKIVPRRVMVSSSSEPREVRVLPRGNWLDETGEVVQPAVPQIFPALPIEDRRATRLDLARWLVQPGEQGGVGKLSARVQANRLWQLLMGVGLARVLDDFGGQGEPPTHPELLDNLAMEFFQSGWDIKHTLKLIAMSSTYRQSSVSTPQLRSRDPDNRLFARQARPRLQAEMIRDNALAVSGLLVREVGGPSVKPYQPPGYYAHLNFPQREYQQHSDARQWRRGVYVHWQRQFLHPMLKAFDAPTREECTAQRSVSNTPTAALVLLNDPTFVEAARALAARVLDEGGSTDADRLAWALRQVTSREADSARQEVLYQLLQKHRRHFAAHPQAAQQIQAIGLTPAPPQADPVELAAWTSVARVLLNLNETITRN